VFPKKTKVSLPSSSSCCNKTKQKGVVVPSCLPKQT
jgi:hypothetical protein